MKAQVNETAASSQFGECEVSVDLSSRGVPKLYERRGEESVGTQSSQRSVHGEREVAREGDPILLLGQPRGSRPRALHAHWGILSLIY